MNRRTSVFSLCVLAVATLIACGGAAFVQDIDAERVAAIKAGMVVNFIKYTRWPDSSFESEQAPIIIIIVGEADIDRPLPAALGRQTSNGRPIEIRHLDYPTARSGESAPHQDDLAQFRQSLRESHLAYLGRSERFRVGAILEDLEESDVLSVSDIDGFAERGGMLGLVIRDNRVAFDANIEAIEAAGFQISSQVLRLARIVASREADPGGKP